VIRRKRRRASGDGYSHGLWLMGMRIVSSGLDDTMMNSRFSMPTRKAKRSLLSL